MKALTYEDWIQNPTPRVMWVWDSFENDKKQRKVYAWKEIVFPREIKND